MRAPSSSSSRRPGGLNAHYSGGQILFFVSPRGEHLHDGVTPRPPGKKKNFQPLSRSPLFFPFSDPLARKRAQKRGAARSQTRPRKVAAEARAHGADPQSDRLLSEPASCRLRGGRELCPRRGQMVAAAPGSARRGFCALTCGS